MEENKELLELLQQVEKANRQQVKLTRLSCIFALIAALCCVGTLGLVYSILPQVTGILSQVDGLAGQIHVVLGNLEDATNQLSQLDLTGMVSEVEELVTTAQTSLEQTMGKLNTIDFQTLNKAIEDLSKVVEPLSKLTTIFK